MSIRESDSGEFDQTQPDRPVAKAAAVAATLHAPNDGARELDSLGDTQPVDGQPSQVPQRESVRMLGRYRQGQSIGRFVAQRVLGAGGMGVVLAAYDPHLDRNVAIKVVHPELAAAARSRLLREAQAMAKLSHQNVITVYEVGAVDDDVFIAMELVEGGTLAAWLRERARSPREVLAMFAKAGRGLAAAHHANLVHRDFKPENVLVGKTGVPRVTDFGLVGSTRAPDAPAVDRARSIRSESLTQTGAIMGTPAYMAPEQFEGAAIDARADQFAFCVALYEAICGRRPFEGSSFAELGGNVLEGRVRPFPRDCPVSTRVRAAITRGLSRDPAVRFSSVDELLAILERDPRKPWIIGGAIAGVAAIATVASVASVAAARDSGPAPCSGARARLGGAWDDSVAANVRQSFIAAAGPYGQASLGRVSAALNSYADRWAKGYTDACEATVVRKEQSEQLLDLRMQCLDRRRGELSALTSLFANADANLVSKGPQPVYALEAPEQCADREALTNQYPPPKPEQSVQVAAFRQRLAHVHAHRAAGKYRDGLAFALPLLDDVKQLSYPPLVSETLLVTARLHNESRQAAATETAYRELTLAAPRARDDKRLARAWIELIGVLGRLEGKATEGLALEAPARSMVERLGDAAPLYEAALDLEVAGVLTTQQQWSAAESRVEHAIGLQAKELAADHQDLASSQGFLANIRSQLGKAEDALAMNGRVLAMQERTLGPDHPAVAYHLSNRAEILRRLQRYDEAFALYDRVLAIEERATGGEGVAQTLIAIARIHSQLRHDDEAMKYFERALSIAEKTRDDQLALSASTGLGGALARAKRCGEAVPHLERGVALLEKLRSNPTQLTQALRSLARCDELEGRMTAAREKLDRAVAIAESLPDSDSIAYELGTRGQHSIYAGRPLDAVPDFQRALDIAAAKKTVPDRTLSALEYGLADAWFQAKRPANAIPHLERALELQATAKDVRYTASSRFLLARALWTTGSRPRARALAKQALPGFEQLGDEPAVAEVRAWLAAH